MSILLALLGLLGVIATATGGSSDDVAVASDNAPEPNPEMTDDDPMDDMNMPPASSEGYVDITEFGMFHGSSSHTMHDALAGGRTAITTEALEAYNGLRDFLGMDPVDLETVGQWAFDNTLTNNTEAYGEDLKGVGLFYSMQGAKAGWIADEKFDPQILADIQRTAREGENDDVMSMIESFGHAGFADFLRDEELEENFINTLKMEPHYGGWMHGRTHGWLEFDDETGAPIAIAHDLNHLTVLSHDQQQPFMNDTFDWPQWPALDMPEEDVVNYFQSMVTLGDPQGEGIATAFTSSLPDMLPMVVYLDPLASAEQVDDEESDFFEMM